MGDTFSWKVSLDKGGRKDKPFQELRCLHVFLHFLNPKRLLPCDQYPKGIITDLFISIFFGFKTRDKNTRKLREGVFLNQCRMDALCGL